MQNFGRKNFDDSTCTRQICQTFPPSKFHAIRYVCVYVCVCLCAYVVAITGFIGLGDIKNHLISLEKNIEDHTISSISLANSMLIVTVKGLFSNLSFHMPSSPTPPSVVIKCMILFGKQWVVLS